MGGLRAEYGFADGSGCVDVNNLFCVVVIEWIDELLGGGFGGDGWTKVRVWFVVARSCGVEAKRVSASGD